MRDTDASESAQTPTLKPLSEAFVTAVLDACEKSLPNLTLTELQTAGWQGYVERHGEDFAEIVEPAIREDVSLERALLDGSLVIAVRVRSLETDNHGVSLKAIALVSGLALDPLCEGEVELPFQANLQTSEPSLGVRSPPESWSCDSIYFEDDTLVSNRRYKAGRPIQFGPILDTSLCLNSRSRFRRGAWSASVRAACYTCVVEALFGIDGFLESPLVDGRKPAGSSDSAGRHARELQLVSENDQVHEDLQTAFLTRWMASAERKTVLKQVVSDFMNRLKDYPGGLPSSFDVSARPLGTWSCEVDIESGRTTRSQTCEISARVNGEILGGVRRPFAKTFDLRIDEAELPSLKEPMRKPRNRYYKDRRSDKLKTLVDET